jgi:hypothetical protein
MRMIGLAALASMLFVLPVEAANDRTRAACTDDYLTHCSHTTPGTIQCRKCFRSNWKHLTQACRSAISADPQYRSTFKKVKRAKHKKRTQRAKKKR